MVHQGTEENQGFQASRLVLGESEEVMSDLSCECPFQNVRICENVGLEAKILMVMLSQGEPGTRGSSSIPGRFGQGGNTGVAGAKGQKGFHGQTVSNIVVVV